MLNETPNNNDVKRVANIVLAKVPDSNDAMRVGNNMRLTAVGVLGDWAHSNSHWWLYI